LLVTTRFYVNELATNAAKYGAMSTLKGSVAIGRKTEIVKDVPTFVFMWQEFDGPQVTEPTRKGFGTRMIECLLAHDFQGDVSLAYRPEGVICRLTTPLRNLEPLLG
jgi:two-component sensor histidine kinase